MTIDPTLTISAVIGLATALGTLLVLVGRVSGRMQGLTERMAALETMMASYFQGASSARDKESAEAQLKPLLEQLNETLERLEKKGNPVTTEEIQRLRTYRNKLAHAIPLEPGEYLDFQELLQKVERELPRREKYDFSLVVAGLVGFVAGLTIGTLIVGEKKKSEKA